MDPNEEVVENNIATKETSESDAAAEAEHKAAMQELMDDSPLPLGGGKDEEGDDNDKPASEGGEEPAGEKDPQEPTEPAAEPEPGKQEPSELEQLRAQLAERDAEIASLKALKEEPKAGGDEPKPDEGKAAGTQGDLPDDQIVSFVSSEEEMDAALADPKALNKLLTKAMIKGAEMATKGIAQLTSAQIDSKFAMASLSFDFYRANPDLASPENRGRVAKAMLEIGSKTPGKPIEEILAEAGNVVRAQIKAGGGKQPGQPVQREEGVDTPGFAGGNGTGRRAPAKIDPKRAAMRELVDLDEVLS